jgi:hypothetical protein
MGITFKILNRMVGLDMPVLEITSSLRQESSTTGCAGE